MNSASRPTAESPRQEWDGEARQELSQARATIRMLEGRLDKWCKDVLEDKRHAIMLAHRHVQEQEIAAAALVKEKQTSQQKLLSRLRARTDANAQGATAQAANTQGACGQNSGSATNSPLRGKHASRGQDNSAAGLQAHRRPRRARDDRGDETDYDNEADDARGTSARAQFVRLVSMQERMIEEREKRDQPLQEHSRIQKGL